jgi:hypothetical protein
MKKEFKVVVEIDTNVNVKTEEVSEYKKWAGEKTVWDFILRMKNGEKFVTKKDGLIYYSEDYKNPFRYLTPSGREMFKQGRDHSEALSVAWDYPVKPYDEKEDWEDLACVRVKRGYKFDNLLGDGFYFLWDKKNNNCIYEVFPNFYTCTEYDHIKLIPKSEEPEWIEKARQKVIELRKSYE